MIFDSPKRPVRVEIGEKDLGIPRRLLQDRHREEGVDEVFRVMEEIGEGVSLHHLPSVVGFRGASPLSPHRDGMMDHVRVLVLGSFTASGGVYQADFLGLCRVDDFLGWIVGCCD